MSGSIRYYKTIRRQNSKVHIYYSNAHISKLWMSMNTNCRLKNALEILRYLMKSLPSPKPQSILPI